MIAEVAVAVAVRGNCCISVFKRLLSNSDRAILTTYSEMNQEHLEAAYKLQNLMDADAIAQADAKVFGDWYTHLSDLLLEALEDKQ